MTPNSTDTNPYQSPEITERQEVEPRYTLFSIPVITGTAFIINLPPAILLMMLNFFRVGRPSAAWGLFVVGIILSVCLFAAKMQTPDTVSSYIFCALSSGAIALAIALIFLGKLLRDHLTSGGKTASWWVTAFVVVMAELLWMSVGLTVFLLLPESWLPEGW